MRRSYLRTISVTVFLGLGTSAICQQPDARPGEAPSIEIHLGEDDQGNRQLSVLARTFAGWHVVEKTDFPYVDGEKYRLELLRAGAILEGRAWSEEDQAPDQPLVTLDLSKVSAPIPIQYGYAKMQVTNLCPPEARIDDLLIEDGFGGHVFGDDFERPNQPRLDEGWIGVGFGADSGQPGPYASLDDGTAWLTGQEGNFSAYAQAYRWLPQDVSGDFRLTGTVALWNTDCGGRGMALGIAARPPYVGFELDERPRPGTSARIQVGLGHDLWGTKKVNLHALGREGGSVKADADFDWQTGTEYEMELMRTGASAEVRVWSVGGSRPGTPTFTADLSALVMPQSFGYLQLQASNLCPVDGWFDNLEVTDGQGTAFYEDFDRGDSSLLDGDWVSEAHGGGDNGNGGPYASLMTGRAWLTGQAGDFSTHAQSHHMLDRTVDDCTLRFRLEVDVPCNDRGAGVALTQSPTTYHHLIGPRW